MSKLSGEILLNPGPVNLSQKVRVALSNKDLCHREKEFGELIKDINKRLGQVYPELSKEDYQSVLLTSSGTGAVEAMLKSFIPKNSLTLVINNGVYGARMEHILKLSNRPYKTLQFNWEEAISIDQIEQALREFPEIKNLALVHHETTTGRLNPLMAIGEVCKQHDVGIFLDAVSSFGAEKIIGEGINLAALAATAGKCLHGAPGISLVMAHPDLWSNPVQEADSVYFDLYDYYKSQYSSGFSPFTQATHVAMAFQIALEEFFEAGGWEQRNELYKIRADQIADSLLTLGVKTLLPVSDFSSVLYSYLLPSGVSYYELHDYLKNKGFVIYQGQGNLQDMIFRISTMGEISMDDIHCLCDDFKQFFDSN